MKSAVLIRAQSLRSAAKVSQRMSMGTLATFKTPKVANEPNVSQSCRGPQAGIHSINSSIYGS